MAKYTKKVQEDVDALNATIVQRGEQVTRQKAIIADLERQLKQEKALLQFSFQTCDMNLATIKQRDEVIAHEREAKMANARMVVQLQADLEASQQHYEAERVALQQELEAERFIRQDAQADLSQVRDLACRRQVTIEDERAKYKALATYHDRVCRECDDLRRKESGIWTQAKSDLLAEVERLTTKSEALERALNECDEERATAQGRVDLIQRAADRWYKTGWCESTLRNKGFTPTEQLYILRKRIVWIRKTSKGWS